MLHWFATNRLHDEPGSKLGAVITKIESFTITYIIGSLANRKTSTLSTQSLKVGLQPPERAMQFAGTRKFLVHCLAEGSKGEH